MKRSYRMNLKRSVFIRVVRGRLTSLDPVTALSRPHEPEPEVLQSRVSRRITERQEAKNEEVRSNPPLGIKSCCGPSPYHACRFRLMASRWIRLLQVTEIRCLGALRCVCRSRSALSLGSSLASGIFQESASEVV
jgi:hypothetical protein